MKASGKVKLVGKVLITVGLHSRTLTTDPQRLQKDAWGAWGGAKTRGRYLKQGGAYLLDSCRLAGGSGSASEHPPSSSAPRTGARSRGIWVRGPPESSLLARLPRLVAPSAPSVRPSLHPGLLPAEELKRPLPE